MATFTAAQTTSLARIFGTSSDAMDYHLDGREELITEDDKTAILLDVTAYVAIEDDNVSIEPKERNFGARLSGGAKRSLIKNRIAGLIGWETVSGGSGLVRA